MAPWDELKFFEVPLNRFIGITTGAQFKLDADPMRVWLAFMTTGSVPLQVQPEDATEGASLTPGFFLRNDVPPLIFRQRDDGPLAQAAWFVSNNSGITTTFTIIQVRMKEWPAPRREGQGV